MNQQSRGFVSKQHLSPNPLSYTHLFSFKERRMNQVSFGKWLFILNLAFLTFHIKSYCCCGKAFGNYPIFVFFQSGCARLFFFCWIDKIHFSLFFLGKFLIFLFDWFEIFGNLSVVSSFILDFCFCWVFFNLSFSKFSKLFVLLLLWNF